jgi:transcriptional regulator with XRE-family HTH domain
VSDLYENLRAEFQDPEYRYGYAESFLNTKLATQIKTLREQRGKTQAEIGALMGISQPGYRRFEDVNHSVWKTDTLWNIARAYGVRLDISFETFGSLPEQKKNLSKISLERPAFEDDPAFKEPEVKEPETEEVATAMIAHSALEGFTGLRASEYSPESDLIRRVMEKMTEPVRLYAQPSMAGSGPLLDLAALGIRSMGVGGESENAPKNPATVGVSRMTPAPKVVSIESGRKTVHDPRKRHKDRGGIKRHAG